MSVGSEPNDNGDKLGAHEVPVVIHVLHEGVDPPQSLPDHPKPERRWNFFVVGLCWAFILGLSCLIAVSVFLGDRADQEDGKQHLIQANSSAKVAVGMRELLSMTSVAEPPPGLVSSRTLEQRLCETIVIYELQGAKQALSALDRIDQLIERLQFESSKTQRSILRSLRDLMHDYEDEIWEGLSLTDREKKELVSELGWCGRLVLQPAGARDTKERDKLLREAKQAAMLQLGFLTISVCVVLLGIPAFVVFVVLCFSQRLRFEFDGQRRNGDIYLETFALWFLAFLAISLLLALLRDALPTGLASLGVLLTLGVLIWPILRGVRLPTMLHELGLAIKNPFKEVVCGLLSYLVAAPFIAAALVVVLILTALANQFENVDELTPAKSPSHPILQEVADSDSWLTLFGIFLTAVVIAPILEEIVFRGLLYRHLRELSHFWGRWISVLFAAAANAIVFAMIHPQGILAIPVLGMLAISFSLAREWRGSLIAPMTMHALNNGAITFLLIFTL
ncbi:MAG TPA: CPBP family intramembrane metalloprotease [Pirellulaceae bacterium]|nr:CPBP family intramembrane metalloprotease [Pirellulaceae bacterium]HMO90735.1 CPBP family intramembrane metalloprotease [Pirellulaceae bacterium]HMP67986.1 CPBP family intramembrane metalloprotease [Pirellulaceae bacterium]